MKQIDSHPGLPLDPDTDKLVIAKPAHTDAAHVAVVGFGAFFGTLARYEISLWLPDGKDGWPMATFLINIAGAFLLGLLLESLLYRGKDKGGRRMLRLMLGTGFLGAFTTYSALATGIVLLERGGHPATAALYGTASVVLGIVAAALGIKAAELNHGQRIRGRA